MLTQILHLVAIASALMTIFAGVVALQGPDGQRTVGLIITAAFLVSTFAIYGLGQAIDYLGRTAHHSERVAEVADGLETQLIALHSTLRLAVQQGGGGSTADPRSPVLDASTRAVLTKAASHLENIDNQTEHGNKLLQWLGEKQEPIVR